MTVYLTLIMTLILSLYLALIEGVRSNAIRLETECVMDIGLNSVLAEYHRELYRQYNLFAIDSSYGTPQAGKTNVERHLQSYMNRNFAMEDIFLEDYFYKDFLAISVEDTNVTRVSILTDGTGEIFRRSAVEAIKDDIGIGMLEKITEWVQIVEDNGLRQRDIGAEKREIDNQIEAYNGMEIQISEEEWAIVDGKKVQISEEKWIIVEVDNPTDGLETMRRQGVLSNVIDVPDTLSMRAINPSVLITGRMEQGPISRGNCVIEKQSTIEQVEEDFIFREYLLNYMGHYGYVDENNALLYQLEYLLYGENHDVDNLRKTANTLCAIREAANAIYLYADEIKCAEAELLATVIATALYVPELAGLLKHTLLLGWAYAESLYDVEVLLEGGCVPLLKNDSDWHYGLEAAMQPGKAGEHKTAGLSYEDYLRILLYFTDTDVLTARAMNMVEADIRMTPGNSAFRLDACYNSIEVCVFVNSAYGYEYEITRQKKYE